MAQNQTLLPRTNNPLLRNPTVRPTTTTLTLPFARRLFLSDCSDHRSDDDDDDDCVNCAYSRPFVVLDMVWNLAFVVVAAAVLLSTFRERPNTPLRLWLCVYAFECVAHMAFVYFEYRRRFSDSSSSSRTPYSVMKKLEPINTLASSVWWAIGFYWIVVGGQDLLEDSPRLYWLTVVFLAFDVFFIIFCIGMACLVFFAIFCFIPIIALAYAMRIREGASEEDIKSLPKYRFSQSNLLVIVDDKKHSRIHSCNGSHVSELSVHPDDSECCICLSPYVDGTELYRLPCTHHFHCGCIGRWLRTKATCPLCKFNILRRDTLV
ncbi:hypothetical protein RIF29_05368 [Crotalaria pallida]|uniref:RING-type E3 ubiquitin transferase n=1 Tax=Crotalaria pallida TaxID=3830 RepID=A0AAN9J292_CROPI